MRVVRDHGSACDRASRSGVSNSSLAAERRAGDLDPADRVLLIGERRAVPDLDQHPDPARDEVGPAAQPVGPLVADPDEAVELVGVLGAEVVGAVLEPHEIARGVLGAGGRRGAAKPELRPAHDDRATADPREVANGVEGHLRIVRAGLHADVAAGDRAGSIASAGNGPNWRSDGGRMAASPNRSSPSRSNSDGPKPNVIVSRDGASPTASPVSSGGTSGSALRSPAGRPEVIRSAASVHARMSSTRSARPCAVTSKAAKCSRSCAAVTIPACRSPRNGTVPVPEPPSESLPIA